jgi:hypothetical protein
MRTWLRWIELDGSYMRRYVKWLEKFSESSRLTKKRIPRNKNEKSYFRDSVAYKAHVNIFQAWVARQQCEL